MARSGRPCHNIRPPWQINSMNPLVCIDEETLRAYQSGTIAAARFDAVAEHVRQCSSCLERLQACDTGDDPLLRALRRQQQAPMGNVDPLVQEAISCVLRSDSTSGPNPLHPALEVGGTLNEYRLLERLGAGGMGAVYRAIHVRLEKEVALKVVQPHMRHDPTWRERFQREVKAIGKLRHPHIVLATDAGEANGVLYLVMELEQGTDLAQHVRRHGPVPVAEACEYARQAAMALQAAHEAGLVHRDVKPSNLFRTNSGQIKLLDLGLARLRAAEPRESSQAMAGPTDESKPVALSGTLGPVGTEDYMAPEQWDDAPQVDARADLYGLGCTLYFLLTGEPPFAAPRFATRADKRRAHVSVPAPGLREKRGDTPPKLAALVQFLLAKQPQDRPATAAEVAKALSAITARPRAARLGVALGLVLMTGILALVLSPVNPWLWQASSLPPTQSAEHPPPAGALGMTSDDARALQQRWSQHLSSPVVATNSLGMEFALVPPGELTIAANYEAVLSRPYYLSVTEVTMAQFRRFVEDSGYRTSAETSGQGSVVYVPETKKGMRSARVIWSAPGYATRSDDYPVVHVGWNDAIAFCDWLSKREARTYRLPTEAEWQWACRAGFAGQYYPGGKAGFGEVAWFVDNSGGYPHAVGKLQPNAWGLYDMHGNVMEWVLDYAFPRPQGKVVDAAIAAAGPHRAIAGSNYLAEAGLIGMMQWQAVTPTMVTSTIGFRVLLEQTPPPR